MKIFMTSPLRTRCEKEILNCGKRVGRRYPRIHKTTCHRYSSTTDTTDSPPSSYNPEYADPLDYAKNVKRFRIYALSGKLLIDSLQTCRATVGKGSVPVTDISSECSCVTLRS